MKQAAELKYKTLPELEAKLKETEQRLSDKAASDSSKQVALYQEWCGRHERYVQSLVSDLPLYWEWWGSSSASRSRPPPAHQNRCECLG